MRWERLFGELEGHAEHAGLAERDALVADLRDGEWAERSWLDGLAGGVDGVELAVRDVGVLHGRVAGANEVVLHLETDTTDYVIAAASVQWISGGVSSGQLDRGSVAARLGWGPVLRAAQADHAIGSLTLVGGFTVAGAVAAVGRDFVTVVASSGRRRDVPTSMIRMAAFER